MHQSDDVEQCSPRGSGRWKLCGTLDGGAQKDLERQEALASRRVK